MKLTATQREYLTRLIRGPERWIPLTDDYGEPTGMMMKKGEVHRVNFRRAIAAAIRALDCFPEVGE